MENEGSSAEDILCAWSAKHLGYVPADLFDAIDEVLGAHAQELAEQIRVRFDVKDKPCLVPSGYVNPEQVAQFIEGLMKNDQDTPG